MQTFSKQLVNGGQGLPPSIDTRQFVAVVHRATDIDCIERSDAAQASLPPRVLAGGVSQITATPFTFPSDFFGIHCAFTEGPSYFYGRRRFLDAGVTWSDIEISSGVYNTTAVAKLTSMIQRCRDLGVKVVYPVPFTPQWASSNPGSTGDGNGTGTAWAPASFATLTSHVNYVLNLLRVNSVTDAVIQGWNEPNTPNVYKDTVPNLVLFQQTIWNAVQAYNLANGTTYTVMSCALTDRSATGPGMTVATLLTAGLGAFCDVWGHHSYSGGFPSGLWVDLPIIDSVKSAFSAASFTKPFMIDECGDSNFGSCTWRDVVRALLYARAQGAIAWCWYSHDAPGVPDMRISRNEAAFISAVNFLRGRNVQWVNRLPGAELCASIDGQVVFI
jgi:hypothetical protein